MNNNRRQNWDSPEPENTIPRRQRNWDDPEDFFAPAMPYKYISLEDLDAARRKKQMTALLIAFSCLVTSLIAMGLIMLIASSSKYGDGKEISQVDLSQKDLLRTRDKYIESVTRWTRDPNSIKKRDSFSKREPEPTGTLQRLVSNMATNKSQAVEEQLKDKDHPAYRKHESLAYALAEVNANEKLRLAALGNGAMLEYRNSMGELKREPIDPAKLAAIGTLDLLAIDMAQQLPERNNFPINDVTAEIAQGESDTRERRASLLAQKHLSNPAEDLRNIEAFRHSIIPNTQPVKVGDSKK